MFYVNTETGAYLEAADEEDRDLLVPYFIRRTYQLDVVTLIHTVSEYGCGFHRN